MTEGEKVVNMLKLTEFMMEDLKLTFQEGLELIEAQHAYMMKLVHENLKKGGVNVSKEASC